MDQHVMSRRQLLQALGLAGVAAPFAAAFGSSTAFAQGACRDGFGRGRCPLDMETATKAIAPVFAPTGWRTVSLDHIAFQVADHKTEAAFYVALMGWKLRSLDDTQAVMDLGDWGTVIFKQGAAAAAPPPAAAGGGRTRARRREQRDRSRLLLRHRAVEREDGRGRTEEARPHARRRQRRQGLRELPCERSRRLRAADWQRRRAREGAQGVECARGWCAGGAV